MKIWRGFTDTKLLQRCSGGNFGNVSGFFDSFFKTVSKRFFPKAALNLSSWTGYGYIVISFIKTFMASAWKCVD